MKADIRIDSLVRGPVGLTDRVEMMRVTSLSPHGWLTGINEAGQQRIMGESGPFELLGDPRPVRERTDIPERLRS